MNSKKPKQFLDSRGIEGGVFDIDNTLLATGGYYRKNIKDMSKKLASKIDDSKSPEEIAKEIGDVFSTSYLRDGKKPLLIDNRYIKSLIEYTGSSIPNEIKESIAEFYKDFYLKSPTPFEYTESVLKAFLELDKSIVLHSHAQEEWTKIKVELLEELVGAQLPYLSTGIDSEKDKESWLRAFELINCKPENILVVGDNFEADILPAIEAGCKHLVWLDTYDVGLEEKHSIPDDVELFIINKIEDILTLE